jgi:hypothetical protein
MLLLLFVHPELSLAQGIPDPNLASVQGTVTDSVTNQKLRKAFVRVVGAGGTNLAVTNENGAFKLDGITPGVYEVETEHQGYVDKTPGVQLRLYPGQAIEDFQIKLMPQAVITGRVIDEEGDAWTHTYLTLFRWEWSRGQRTLRSVDGGEVNDLGEFRFAGLAPGTYYVSAAPDARWEATHRPRSKDQPLELQATWFPSSPNRTSATPVALSPGGLVSVQIRLRRGSAHSVRGSLSGAVPQDTSPFGRRSIGAFSDDDTSPGKSGVVHPDGTFEISGLAEGQYELRVVQGYPSLELGSAKISLENRDIEGVSIELSPPRPIQGKIRIEGDDSPQLGGRQIQLYPVRPTLGGGYRSATSHDDGTFEFPLAGSNRNTVEVLGSGFYLKELRYGEVVSNDGTISFAGAPADLIVTLNAKPAGVVGTVSNRGSSSEIPQVVLIPKDRTGTRVARFDQNGAFTIDAVVPGAYVLYAFEGIPEGAWEDKDLLKELVGKGTELQLGEGERKALDLPLLLKSDLAPVLSTLGIE